MPPSELFWPFAQSLRAPIHFEHFQFVFNSEHNLFPSRQRNLLWFSLDTMSAWGHTLQKNNNWLFRRRKKFGAECNLLISLSPSFDAIFCLWLFFLFFFPHRGLHDNQMEFSCFQGNGSLILRLFFSSNFLFFVVYLNARLVFKDVLYPHLQHRKFTCF